MPAPSDRDRRAISAAVYWLNRGLSAAEVQLQMGHDRHGYSSTEIANAVRKAVEYRLNTDKINKQMAGGKGIVGPRGDKSLGNFTGANVTGEGTVGLTVRWWGELKNGLPVKGSTVFNVDSTASVALMEFRVRAAIFRGYINFPHIKYEFATLHIEILTSTPYGRDAGYELDTSKVNPYK
jgi:hypothetical protein